MPGISKEDIARLEYDISLPALASEYLTLKKTGKNYKGTCPFHTEKTPSFNIASYNRYRCFGCGATGGVIRFYMEIENKTFIEAFRELSNKKEKYRI